MGVIRIDEFCVISIGVELGRNEHSAQAWPVAAQFEIVDTCNGNV